MERSPYIEALPFIDAHGVEVNADVDTTWRALLRVTRGVIADDSWLGRALHVEPAGAAGSWSPDVTPDAALPGFAVDDVRPGKLLSLRGRHRFALYRLDFELDQPEVGRCHVWARSWAEFPGLAGRAYRALVIGTGGHRLVVRRILRQVAATA